MSLTKGEKLKYSLLQPRKYLAQWQAGDEAKVFVY